MGDPPVFDGWAMVKDSSVGVAPVNMGAGGAPGTVTRASAVNDPLFSAVPKTLQGSGPCFRYIAMDLVPVPCSIQPVRPDPSRIDVTPPRKSRLCEPVNVCPATLTVQPQLFRQ